MPSHLRQEILEAYFSPDTGNAYSYAEPTSISCDSRLKLCLYGSDGDVDLKHFSIERMTGKP